MDISHGQLPIEREQREQKRPLGKEPYARPNDLGLQIYHESRRYGYHAGKIEQLEYHWFAPEPTDKASQNIERYALSDLGIP